MPKFEAVKLAKAKLRTARVSSFQIMPGYFAYIKQLRQRDARKLQPLDEESVARVRLRPGDAAKDAGMGLTIKRSGDDDYSWTEDMRRREKRTREGR